MRLIQLQGSDAQSTDSRSRTEFAGRIMPPGKTLVAPATQNGGKAKDPPSREGASSPFSRLTTQLDRDERLVEEQVVGKRVGLYRLYGDLGSGNFSDVKLAVHQLTSDRVAVKIASKSKMNATAHSMLSKEIANMDRLHHPHITRLYEVLETPARIHLVMEYAAGGSLQTYVDQKGCLTELEARPVVTQLLSAVQHMHSLNVVHRDIKAENVLLSRHQQVKLADLGFSTHIETSDQQLTEFCGSPPYAAPELLQAPSYSGPPVDIWAVGVLTYLLVCGEMPFPSDQLSTLKRQILAGGVPWPEQIGTHCRRFVSCMMRPKPDQRLTAGALLRTQWLRGQRLPAIGRPFTVSTSGCSNTALKAGRERLRRLGVDKEDIDAHWKRGCRSPVTGLFRIEMHRMMRYETGEDVDPSLADDLKPWLSTKNGTVCVIL